MSHHQHKSIRSLAGYFLGWGDERTPHRYIKLATIAGEQLLVKVAKSLRSEIQDWQPGMWLTLLSQERIDRVTGERQIKAKQLLGLPSVHQPLSSSPPPVAMSAPPTKIQICQGSSCRRRGSAQICQSMQAYLQDTAPIDNGNRVEIEMVKCLHQCKAAPQAIFTSPTGSILPGKTHYRQIQPSQVPAILAKHFPIAAGEAIDTNFIDKISTYLQQQISTAAATL
jgi:(2Fe-2S) ferredoxin